MTPTRPSTTARTPSQTRRPSATRPPSRLVFASLAGLVVTLLMFRAGDFLFGATAINFLGFVIGSIGGLALLAAFVHVEDKRRESGRYTDWRIPARQVVKASAWLSWAFGIGHSYFFALEMTRGVLG